jgi:uncharacterized protein YicC (UPF0701 family)
MSHEPEVIERLAEMERLLGLIRLRMSGFVSEGTRTAMIADMAELVGLLDQDTQLRAKTERSARRVQVAMRLDRAATHLGDAKNELDQACAEGRS